MNVFFSFHHTFFISITLGVAVGGRVEAGSVINARLCLLVLVHC